MGPPTPRLEVPVRVQELLVHLCTAESQRSIKTDQPRALGADQVKPGLGVGERLPNLRAEVPRKVRVESSQEHHETAAWSRFRIGSWARSRRPGDLRAVHLEPRMGSAPAMDSLSRAGSFPGRGRDKRRADATAVAKGFAGRSSRPSAAPAPAFQSSL